jgi:hypothetical protein
MTSAIEILTAAASKLTDAQIIEALGTSYNTSDEAERLVRISLREVLERRHDVAEAMDAWADDMDSDLSYDEALILAVG